MKWGCCMISNCQKYLEILLTFICVIVDNRGYWNKRKAMVRAMTFQFIFAFLFSRNTCQFYIYVIISYTT